MCKWLKTQMMVRSSHSPVALELVQELAEYLSVRYPTTFCIQRWCESDLNTKRFVERGWGGAPPIKSVTIAPLGVTYELNENAEDMMRVAALLLVFSLWLFVQ